MNADATVEARELVDAASARGLVLRVLGGVAVRLLCPNVPPRVRDGQDVDVATNAASRRALTDLFTERGYVPDKNFNALYGNKQLYFTDPENGRAVDVIVDKLEMSHTLELATRLTRMPYTLDPLDLLLTKLQIVELNEKDVTDCLSLLVTFPLADSEEPGTMDLRVFRELVGDDWGWWRTITANLEKLRALASAAPAGTYDPAAQLDTLARAAEEAPKSRRWKLRARVGDRVRWYELPEETAHG
jgi:hypothetical protein